MVGGFGPFGSYPFGDDGAGTGGVPGNADGVLGNLVTISGLAGNATGSAAAGGAFTTITLNNLEATTTGASSASGSFTDITVSSLLGQATGAAAASGPLSSVLLTSLSGSAAGDAAAVGQLTWVDVSTLGVAATGEAATAGGLATVGISSFGATVTGAGNATGQLVSVNVSALEGSATAGAVGASGVIGSTVSTTTFGATVTAGGSATGSLGGVVITTPFSGVITSVTTKQPRGGGGGTSRRPNTLFGFKAHDPRKDQDEEEVEKLEEKLKKIWDQPCIQVSINLNGQATTERFDLYESDVQVRVSLREEPTVHVTARAFIRENRIRIEDLIQPTVKIRIS